MSWQTTAAVRDRGPRDRRLRLLLFAMASRSTADGLVTVSLRRIADDVGASVSTTHGWVRDAVDRRWLIVLDPGDAYRGVPASYRIAITHPQNSQGSAQPPPRSAQG